MTNDNPKSNCCGAEVIMSHCKACGKSLSWYEYTNDNPKWECSPICINCGGQTHRDDYDLLPNSKWCDCKPLPSEPKCEHDEGYCWTREIGGSPLNEHSILKTDCSVCPYCPKPLPSECPVCLTVQTGAHTCKRAKPLPSEPKCEHDWEPGYWWKSSNDFCRKDKHPTCPFCKPVEPLTEKKDLSISQCCGCLIWLDRESWVCSSCGEDCPAPPSEPSVEAFDAGLIQEIYDYCDYRRKVSGVARDILELIKKRKNERNRK